MIDIENRFKRWLAGEGPRPPLGTWLMAAAPATAEAMGYAGFDFLVVDMEHVPIEVSDLTHILRAIGCTPADAVVRLAWNDQVLIKRVLDAGAQTIMVPFVQTAEEARQAVSFAKYPPEGVRGVAAVHRGSRFGRATDYLKRANGEVAVIVQLETPDAIERLPEIAAVPGVDGLFVGPGDLVGRHGSYRQYHSSRRTGADPERRQGRPCSRKARRHRRAQSRHGSSLPRLRLRLCRRRFRYRHDDRPGIRLARYSAGRACSSGRAHRGVLRS